MHHKVLERSPAAQPVLSQTKLLSAFTRSNGIIEYALAKICGLAIKLHVEKGDYRMRFIRLDSCDEGMILGKSIYGQNGLILLKFGTPLKQSHIDSLIRLGYTGIYIEDELSKDIIIPEIIRPETNNRAQQAIRELFNGSVFAELYNTAVMVKEVENVLEEIISQIVVNKSMVANVNSLKKYDDYTHQHCVDVGILSIILGQELRLSRNELISLGKAAFFHDIGKMFVQKNILNKPERLTPDEFEEIKKHSQYGHDCIKDVLKQPEPIYKSVLHHHERFDGSGYPNNVLSDDIPLFAKIIAVTDVYNAITSKRPYKNEVIATEAYEYIVGNAGKYFDGSVVNAFVKKIPPFAAGMIVHLSDNKRAIVVENRADAMMRPLVRLIDGAEPGKSAYLDLALNEEMRKITIVGNE